MAEELRTEELRTEMTGEDEPDLECLCEQLLQIHSSTRISQKHREIINKIIKRLDHHSTEIPDCLLLLKPNHLKVLAKTLFSTSTQKQQETSKATKHKKRKKLKNTKVQKQTTDEKNVPSTSNQTEQRMDILLEILRAYRSRVLGENYVFEVDRENIWTYKGEEVQMEDYPPLLEAEKAEDLACHLQISKFYFQKMKVLKEDELIDGLKLLIKFQAQIDLVKVQNNHCGVLNVLLQYGQCAPIKTESTCLHDALKYGLGILHTQRNTNPHGDSNTDEGTKATEERKEDLDTEMGNPPTAKHASNHPVDETMKDASSLKDGGHGDIERNKESVHDTILGYLESEEDYATITGKFEPLKTMLQLAQIVPLDLYPGINPFICDSDGNNLLSMAAMCTLSKRSIVAMDILLHYNIDPYHRNKKGENCFDLLDPDDPRISVLNKTVSISGDALTFMCKSRVERSVACLNVDKLKKPLQEKEEIKAKRLKRKRKLTEKMEDSREKEGKGPKK